MIAEWSDDSGVAYGFDVLGEISHDAGKSVSKRLEEGESKPFAMRCKDVHIRGVEETGYVASLAENPCEQPRGPLDIGSQWPVADNEQADLCILGRPYGGQRVLTLVERADPDRDDLRVANVEVLTSPRALALARCVRKPNGVPNHD